MKSVQRPVGLFLVPGQRDGEGWQLAPVLSLDVVRVLTIAGREFPRRRVGAAPRDERAAQPSAAMELGEAVQTAIEHELPLLLSSEAAGQLRDSTRVGRGSSPRRPD